jgi:hypothetical protein
MGLHDVARCISHSTHMNVNGIYVASLHSMFLSEETSADAYVDMDVDV